jgi:hypothetical protein
VSDDSSIADRQRFSQERLQELSRQLAALQELKHLPPLTIFAAGSFGRHEASPFSDLDLFFLIDGRREDVADWKTHSLRLFGKVIEIADRMKFPKFSNDCEYLVLTPTAEVIDHIGSRLDDHANYFTARMLLLLESKCLYGHAVYHTILRRIIDSYFKDYPDHQDNFEPTFLLNDICRYWKTILLNYENRRSIRLKEDKDDPGISELKAKHRVKNFKLKFSRVTTCFASIATIGSLPAPVDQQSVLELTQQTPLERLKSLAVRFPEHSELVHRVLREYEWFLKLTGLSTTDIEAKFADTVGRTEMFDRANAYGDLVYQLVTAIDRTTASSRLLRNLVI